MSERTELPTPARLEALREQGIVPFNLLASRCFGALGLLGALFAMGDEVAFVAASFGKALGASDSGLSALYDPTMRSARIVGIAIASGASSTLLAGLLQTRFTIRFPSRIPKHRPGVIPSSIAGLVSAAFAVSVACMLGGLALPSLFSLLNSRAGELRAIGVQRLAWIVLSALAITGAIAVMIGRLLFMWRHRTTKHEAQQDMEGPG